jgi:hypothetical protein
VPEAQPGRSQSHGSRSQTYSNRDVEILAKRTPQRYPSSLVFPASKYIEVRLDRNRRAGGHWLISTGLR